MYHFIINPLAASGKGRDIWKLVEVVLKEEEISYEAHILRSGEETEEFTRRLTGNGMPCHLVVLGGDGTLNAVLNGIEDFEHTVLSCIRTGSGNDFASNMKISRHTVRAVRHLLTEPEEIVLDYGRAEYRYRKNGEEYREARRFLISSGVGYDADICEEAGRSCLKRFLNRFHFGKLVYVVVGIKQIFTRQVTDAVITLDDGRKLKVPGLFFVVGMVHEREGGGVPFCPGADARDGLLDVCLVESMPKWKLLLAVVLVYAKQHFRFQRITRYRCRRLLVRVRKPQWFHMDGETPCRILNVEMECRSGLRFQK